MISMDDPEVIESLRYLLVPKEERIRNQVQPFDGKKQCFVPDHNEGFLPAEITGKEGNLIVVRTSKGDVQKVKEDDIQQMNPPKYEKCDDMADLTYLNDATVLHNLRSRYMDWFIYTYSGLFCVAINPYKRLPVYTMKMVHYYRGKKKNEVPPHLYLVADNAYSCMMRDRENQSMLITGESGAGKTENTKKVIQYFAFVAAANAPKKAANPEDANKASLEDQIVSANPVLEAYGNAKTTRNNNSSRFGKFIRIHFSSSYAIAGADIESYLLEKSRITFQQPAERNYHIFYQLLSSAFPSMVKDLLLEQNPSLYFHINQGMLTIDGVDDAQEMRDTKKAFDILSFSAEQQDDLFKNTAAVCIWGNSKWKQKPRDEQAEADGTEELEKVATLLSIDKEELIKGLTKPRIKVGNEFVNKGQNKTQVENAVGALSKAIYARCFNWLVERVNETLDVKTIKRAYFIGVLDIAGFEVFDYNGFEQLCINFTNERLQQFFNHFMFVLEQEEYQKEGIVWEMMNFGLDLQACIDLIEKPLGIFSILEEECIVPKGTDMTFKEKLYNNHLGKHPCFGKPKPKKGAAEAHFDLSHYAGTVSYNVTGWLEKNKDPINNTVAALFKASKGNKLLSYLFQDIGLEETGKKAKSGSGNTISAGHREQLNKLMNTLKATHPHFVRCIIPNEIKTGGVLDAHLVLHQLHCNGVLEGIRICRKGFPSRVPFADFVQRYSILAPAGVKANKENPKKGAAEILKESGLSDELYRIGLTKVLVKAGVLGTLEEQRDIAVSKILVMLQSYMRLYIMKKEFKKLLVQKVALSTLQRNLKAYIGLRNWPWWKLFTKMKPLLGAAKRAEEEAKRKAEEEAAAAAEAKRIAEEAKKREEMLKNIEATLLKVEEEKKVLSEERDKLAEKSEKLERQKHDLENQVGSLEEKLAIEEEAVKDLNNKRKKLETEVNETKKELQDFQIRVNKAENENKTKEMSARKLQDEIAHLDENLAKTIKEKKRAEETSNQLNEQLLQEEDKVNHLNKLKTKLEQNLDEAEENLEREKKGRADLDKIKRKLEGDIKNCHATIEDLERIKNELEANLKRKDVEVVSALAKSEDEHNMSVSLQKRIKELQQSLDEAQEAAESERQSRSKVEKQRSDISREFEELSVRLEEAGGASSAQLELNKKREAELVRLRRDLEEANAQHELTTAQLRKKHQDAVNEMAEQIDILTKSRNKSDKEKQLARAEIEEAKMQCENFLKIKINIEKVVKQLEIQIIEITFKLEESIKTQIEISSQKSKLQSENSNLLTQLEEAESHINGFLKAKQQLQAQLEEAKRIADEESRMRSALNQKLRNVVEDLETTKALYEEEVLIKIELQKTVVKLNGEAQIWRSKYEVDGLARAEELEDAKRKLALKLAEAEEQVEQALAKCISLEKAKLRLQNEMEDLLVDVERANANSATIEKKQKQFDKLIAEWKQKCEDITLELDLSQKEARSYSTELFKLKSQYSESLESIEALRRENKNLAEEIKDLMDQLSEGGKSVHEIEKSRKRLELEKDELQSAIEAAESALEQEEAKFSRIQLELTTVRMEIDKRLREKEDEFENTRKNHQRIVESMQASFDAENKTKCEALRQKKKLESDINELEIALDFANRQISDLNKSVKSLNITIVEMQVKIEDEQRLRDEVRDALMVCERYSLTLKTEIEEMRSSYEQAERHRKAAENELHDAANRISELANSNTNLTAIKRKLDSEVASLQADLDEAIKELKNSEERVRKAASDAARLADELHMEQETSIKIEKLRKILEIQVRDLQLRLDEAESNALKGGSRIIHKLEQRIHELESTLEVEQRHHQETIKEVRFNDRRLKEISFQVEEDRKIKSGLQEMIEKLNNKIRVLKRQIDEAEEIAALNLGKFRKAQNELDDAAERAEIAENQLNKQRLRVRTTMSVGRIGSQDRDIVRSENVTVRSTSVVQRSNSIRN